MQRRKFLQLYSALWQKLTGDEAHICQMVSCCVDENKNNSASASRAITEFD